MSLTTDSHEAWNSGTRPDGQHEKYVILSADERAKGFVRPVRTRYRHIGRPGPRFELVDLTDEQRERHRDFGYVKFEPYPESEHPITGQFWTQEQLVDRGCGTVTTMAVEIAETYARNPSFYGGTFCAGCGTHLSVGSDGEFVWEGTEERVGT